MFHIHLVEIGIFKMLEKLFEICLLFELLDLAKFLGLDHLLSGLGVVELLEDFHHLFELCVVEFNF
jgi:hypothetical protein